MEGGKKGGLLVFNAVTPLRSISGLKGMTFQFCLEWGTHDPSSVHAVLSRANRHEALILWYYLTAQC